MSIRVFLMPWSETVVSGGIDISNPISDYLANVSLSAPVVSIDFYARRSLNTRPDKAYLVKVMRGNVQAAEWDALDALPGVQMLPPGAFDKTVASLNNPTRNRIYTALDGMGVPRSTLDSAATIGGFLRNVLAELDPANVGFGAWELEAAEWA